MVHLPLTSFLILFRDTGNLETWPKRQRGKRRQKGAPLLHTHGIPMLVNRPIFSLHQFSNFPVPLKVDLEICSSQQSCNIVMQRRQSQQQPFYDLFIVLLLDLPSWFQWIFLFFFFNLSVAFRVRTTSHLSPQDKNWIRISVRTQ